MKRNIILMADIVKSRKIPARRTADNLKLLANTTNKKFKSEILSPLTITLGDEFQAVIKDVISGIRIIIFIEEFCIEKDVGFKLRYVLVNGEIETPINRKIAYGMLGEGLTRARETINNQKKSGERFFFLTDKNASELNSLFILYQSFIDDWKPRDFKIVSDFINLDDYKLVAEKNQKSVSLMWKRRKSLKIKEYKTIKNLITQYYGLV